MNKQDKDVFSHYFHSAFTGGPIQKKKINVIQVGNKEAKLVLFPDDTII